MKKICLSLLLTTNVMFVSCMEQERSQPIPIYTNTLATQHSHRKNSPYTWQPPVCEANQPGWEFYDDIANMTYNSNQPTMNEVQLTPVYKPAKTTITQQEQKPLLQTNSLKPDETIMETLYTTASHIIFNEYKYSRKIRQKDQHKRVVQLIKDMNNAKGNGINEDLMGEFAYEHADTTFVDDEVLNPLSPIIFILLKKYNEVVQKTGEIVPSFDSPKKAYITQHPAFFQLIYNVKDAAQELSIDAVKVFMTYLYKNNNILLEDYSNGSYKDFKNEFYANAYDLLLGGYYTDLNLFHLLQMIEKAKEDGMHNDDDLIDYMTHFTGSKPTAAHFYSIFDSSHNIDNVTKKIVRFCKLIKDYNNARGFKITPTPNQQHAYLVKTALNITLPESLKNKDLLDENSYAFIEIENLIIDTNELIKLSADEL